MKLTNADGTGDGDAWTHCARCDVDLVVDWDDIDARLPCPACGVMLAVVFDEQWDPDSGEEWTYWWTEVSP